MAGTASGARDGACEAPPAASPGLGAKLRSPEMLKLRSPKANKAINCPLSKVFKQIPKTTELHRSERSCSSTSAFTVRVACWVER